MAGRRWSRGGVAALVAVMTVLAVRPAAHASEAARVRHGWPVEDARVTRPFDPPDAPWAGGHRGVDLAAPPGSAIVASAAGMVVHAGPVVDAIWVTLDHADGVRTSYGPMATVVVQVGERLARGQMIGTASGQGRHLGIHWSARRGAEYLDPLDLLDGMVVPTLLPGPDWVASQRHDLPGYEPWDGRDLTLGFLPATAPATSPGWLAAPTPNHVVTVAGLMTSTGSVPLEVSHLGYDPRDVTWLSHEGRSAGDGEVDDPLRDQLPYTAADTFEGVEHSARLLEAQLRAQWAREPGVAVDLVGHSFGGVVVMHYLMAIHDPADPGLPPIANAVTLAAPLGGADLVDVADAAFGSPGVAGAAASVAMAVLGVPAAGGTLDDLAIGSPLLRDLASSWAAAQADPHRSPLATGTRVLTIGASRDPVVPDHRAGLPGAEHVVVPGGHSGMHGTQAVLQVVRAFLRDEPVPASNGGWGAWLAPGWSVAEHAVAGLVG